MVWFDDDSHIDIASLHITTERQVEAALIRFSLIAPMLSRAADCLYWMSRYVERAENNARILDVNQQLMLDFESQSEADRAPPLVAHHQFARRTRTLPQVLRSRPMAIRSSSSSPSSRRIPTASFPA